MNKQAHFSKKADQALESLDGIKRAEPRPFFYSRLIGRLQGAERSWWETTGSFLAKPVMVVACLALVLIFNAFILFNQDANTGQSVAGTNSETVADNEYIVASNSSFDYENFDQQ